MPSRSSILPTPTEHRLPKSTRNRTVRLFAIRVSASETWQRSPREERERMNRPDSVLIAWPSFDSSPIRHHPNFRLALRDVEIRQRALEGLGGERNGFREGRMGMNGQTDVRRIGAHFDRERHFGNQIAGVGSDHPGTDDSVRLLVEQ